MKISTLLPAGLLLLAAACGRAPAPNDAANSSAADEGANPPAAEASASDSRPIVTYYSIPG